MSTSSAGRQPRPPIATASHGRARRARVPRVGAPGLGVDTTIGSEDGEPASGDARSRGKLTTRRRLLQAGALEFCEHSYFGTDTNQIARRAGLASGSFYNHFVDKFDIFIRLFIDYADRERFEVFAELACVDVDEPTALRRLATKLVAKRRTLARFRASLEMLTRTEERVVEARRMNQAKTIQRITGMPVSRVPKAVRSTIGLRFLVINAITDSLTSSRSLSFGINEADALAAVTEELRTIARLAQSAARARATRQ